MDVGTLVGVTGYIWMLTNHAHAVQHHQHAVPHGYQRRACSTGPGLQHPGGQRGSVAASFKGHVVFDHVSFSYGSKLVLDDISFEALPGQTVAVMGPPAPAKARW